MNDRHSLLRRYILGTVGKWERARAERYLKDDKLLDELLAAENELLDQYVRGALTPQEREAFAGYLHCLPNWQSRVDNAASMARVAGERLSAAEASLNEKIAARHASSGRSWAAWLSTPIRAPLSAAVSLLVVVAVAAWFAVRQQQLRGENERLRAQVAAQDSERQTLHRQAQDLEQQLGAQRTRAGQLQTELERERQRAASQARDLARLQPSPSGLFALVLDPPSRAVGRTETLRLARDAKFVALKILLDGRDRYTRRRAVLRTTEGKLVWEQERRLKPSARLGEVILRLPAENLTPDVYKLTLNLLTDRGLELAYDYYLNVIRE